jgi:uncharacterized membrane protein YbaN (DUF454 family)/shikimate kinase
MRIFIIGSGGVGKTTCGRLLADLLGYNFIALDEEYTNKHGTIDDYINEQGYERYSLENSRLFYEILEKIRPDCVFVLSSGFFTYDGGEGLAEEHTKTVREQGISILLFPSESLEKSADIVVKRQLERRLGYKEETERNKFNLRYPKYKVLGDIKIFSEASPAEIAQKMMIEIEKYGSKSRVMKQRTDSNLLRIIFLIAGTVSVGLGIVGIFLPLLPTTPFLLLAAVCYARSSQRFYDWLMTNRWFGNYIKNYRERRGITLKIKILAISTLWVTIMISAFWMIKILFVRIILLIIAGAVSWHILSFKTLKIKATDEKKYP